MKALFNNKKYDYKEGWTSLFDKNKMAFPAEGCIRVFKGKYPLLNLKESSYKNKKILDLGCGDGRNIVLLKNLGLKVYALEITEQIVNKIRLNLNKAGIFDIELVVGTNANIPYSQDMFDFLLSWGACYYMESENQDFQSYVKEFSRVLKKGGKLILNIPKKSHEIFVNSENLRSGYRIIRNDPWGNNIRNGAIFRVFEDEEDIKLSLSSEFNNFVFSSIEDNFFGFNYHFHLLVCDKK